jgi:hypothetical protein
MAEEDIPILLVTRRITKKGVVTFYKVPINTDPVSNRNTTYVRPARLGAQQQSEILTYFSSSMLRPQRLFLEQLFAGGNHPMHYLSPPGGIQGGAHIAMRIDENVRKKSGGRLRLPWDSGYAQLWETEPKKQKSGQ